LPRSWEFAAVVFISKAFHQLPRHQRREARLIVDCGSGALRNVWRVQGMYVCGT